MLDKELNKLRDKTLSFGCVILNDAKLEERYDGSQGKNHIYEVIGHPLTLGRIYHIYWNVNQGNRDLAFYEVRHAIEQWLVDNNRLDKSELERMQHEKRPELKKHLIQFSNYL